MRAKDESDLPSTDGKQDEPTLLSALRDLRRFRDLGRNQIDSGNRDRSASARKTKTCKSSMLGGDFRGVTYHIRTGRWEAHIWKEGKQIYLGGFAKAELAALAHDVAAVAIRGMDARTNFNLERFEHQLEDAKKQMSIKELILSLRNLGKQQLDFLDSEELRSMQRDTQQPPSTPTCEVKSVPAVTPKSNHPGSRSQGRKRQLTASTSHSVKKTRQPAGEHTKAVRRVPVPHPVWALGDDEYPSQNLQDPDDCSTSTQHVEAQESYIKREGSTCKQLLSPNSTQGVINSQYWPTRFYPLQPASTYTEALSCVQDLLPSDGCSDSKWAIYCDNIAHLK